MSNNKDKENNFENIINNAIKNENFKEIGDLIEDGIDTALDVTKRSLSKIINKGNRKVPYSIQNDDRIINQSPKTIKKIKGWDLLAKVSIIFHTIMLMIFVSNLFTEPAAIIGNIAILVFWLIPALCISFYGVSRIKKLKNQLIRFRKYNRAIGNNTVIPVGDLAAITAKPIDFTIKDLLNMIEKDYYRQARIVENGKLFILDSRTYKLYKDQALEINNSDKKKELNEDIEILIKQAKKEVTELTKISEKIKEPMNTKIRALLNVIGKIFELLRENPNNANDLEKTIKYYLPTTVKLSNAYIEMSDNPTNSIKNSLKEIERTMDTINDAFLKILDNLYAEKVMDLSSDISVLKNMLRQEGLLDEDEFKIGR